MKQSDIYGAGMGPARETAVGEASGPASGAKPAFAFGVAVVILIFVRMLYEWAD